MSAYRAILCISLGFILAFIFMIMEFAPDVFAEQVNTLLNMEWWNLYNTRIVGIGVGITGLILLVRGARP